VSVVSLQYSHGSLGANYKGEIGMEFLFFIIIALILIGLIAAIPDNDSRQTKVSFVIKLLTRKRK
jgi:hypothetical protein